MVIDPPANDFSTSGSPNQPWFSKFAVTVIGNGMALPTGAAPPAPPVPGALEPPVPEPVEPPVLPPLPPVPVAAEPPLPPVVALAPPRPPVREDGFSVVAASGPQAGAASSRTARQADPGKQARENQAIV